MGLACLFLVNQGWYPGCRLCVCCRRYRNRRLARCLCVNTKGRSPVQRGRMVRRRIGGRLSPRAHPHPRRGSNPGTTHTVFASIGYRTIERGDIHCLAGGMFPYFSMDCRCRFRVAGSRLAESVTAVDPRSHRRNGFNPGDRNVRCRVVLRYSVRSIQALAMAGNNRNRLDLWLRHLYGRSRHTCVGGGLGLSIGRPVEAKEGYTGGLAPWVFLEGSPPELPNQEALRPRRALTTGIVVGLVFWLLWESYLFRNHFPIGIADAINSVFSPLFTWTAQIFGDKNFLLAGSAMAFQAIAAAIS